MISGSKHFGGFTTCFTSVDGYIVYELHVGSHVESYRSKEVAEQSRAYYERIGESVSMDEKQIRLRSGEVQI